MSRSSQRHPWGARAIRIRRQKTITSGANIIMIILYCCCCCCYNSCTTSAVVQQRRGFKGEFRIIGSRFEYCSIINSTWTGESRMECGAVRACTDINAGGHRVRERKPKQRDLLAAKHRRDSHTKWRPVGHYNARTQWRTLRVIAAVFPMFYAKKCRDLVFPVPWRMSFRYLCPS